MSLHQAGKPVAGQLNPIPGTQPSAAPQPGPGTVADPMVSADPPQVATPPVPAQVQATPLAPEPKPEPKAEPKPEPKAEPKRTTPMATQKPKRKPKNVQDNILSRARRLMKKEMKGIWEALGLEGDYDEEKLKAHLAEMEKQRTAGLSDVEKQTAYIEKLEKEKAALMAEKSQLQKDLTETKRDLTLAERNHSNFKTEQEIASVAHAAGFGDSKYGLHLFKQHVRGLAEGEQADPSAFFEGLKKDKQFKNFFVETPVAAGPQPVGQQQAPQQPAAPQSQPNQQPTQGAPQQSQPAIPPQGQPSPTAPNGQATEPNALDMDRQQFNEHARSRYGFVPGMA